MCPKNNKLAQKSNNYAQKTLKHINGWFSPGWKQWISDTVAEIITFGYDSGRRLHTISESVHSAAGFDQKTLKDINGWFSPGW